MKCRIAIALVSLSWCTAVAAAQVPVAGTAPAPPAPGAVAPLLAAGEPGLYLGVGSCLGSGCHAGTRPRAGERVLGNEYYTWLRRDPHQRAYNTLFSQDSRLIAGNLRLGRPAHEAPACLACHTVAAPARSWRGKAALEDGVSCEGCHGPASGWRDAHTDPSWSHHDSLAAGLVDLARPEVRAGRCLACHLGGASAAVDHELIAAGHPALAFELDNFAQQMPPHWKSEPGDGLTTWAAGQAAAFAAGLEMLDRRAASEGWPEFSELSCYACHHSLKGERWREKGGYPGRPRPGQPPWSPARWAVLRELVELAAPGERAALDREVAALADAVGRLNRPAEVRRHAGTAAKSIERLLPAVAGLAWSPARVRSLLAALAADRDGLLTADVHAAEQGFFAAQTLAGHLLGGDPRNLRGPLPSRLDALYRLLADPEAFDRRTFAAGLAAVARAGAGN